MAPALSALPQNEIDAWQSEQHSLLPLVPGAVSRFLGHDDPDYKAPNAAGDAPPASPYKTFTLRPEAFRFVSYMFFIVMCLFAMAQTKTAVSNYIGPQHVNTCDNFVKDYTPMSSCDSPTAIPRFACPVPGVPPFNGAYRGVNRTQGFDIEHSHLMEAFGFNNICVNWDYSPSRERTAVVYPLFEFSLLLYVVLNYMVITLNKMQTNAISPAFYMFAHVSFYAQLVLCAMFRMIFVVIAYENVRGHTAGFLCLQFSLMLVTVSNSVYVLHVNRAHGARGAAERAAFYAYLFANLAVGIVKLYLTAYVVFGIGLPFRIYPCWAKGPALFGMKWGELVDRVWMIFNVILPIIISFVRSRIEPKLVIRINLKNAD